MSRLFPFDTLVEMTLADLMHVLWETKWCILTGEPW